MILSCSCRICLSVISFLIPNVRFSHGGLKRIQKGASLLLSDLTPDTERSVRAVPGEGRSLHETVCQEHATSRSGRGCSSQPPSWGGGRSLAPSLQEPRPAHQGRGRERQRGRGRGGQKAWWPGAGAGRARATGAVKIRKKVRSEKTYVCAPPRGRQPARPSARHAPHPWAEARGRRGKERRRGGGPHPPTPPPPLLRRRGTRGPATHTSRPPPPPPRRRVSKRAPSSSSPPPPPLPPRAVYHGRSRSAHRMP